MTLTTLKKRYENGESPLDVAPSIHEACLKMPHTYLHVIPLQVLMDSASLAVTIKEADRCAHMLIGAKPLLCFAHIRPRQILIHGCLQQNASIALVLAHAAAGFVAVC